MRLLMPFFYLLAGKDAEDSPDDDEDDGVDEDDEDDVAASSTPSSKRARLAENKENATPKRSLPATPRTPGGSATKRMKEILEQGRDMRLQGAACLCSISPFFISNLRVFFIVWLRTRNHLTLAISIHLV